MKNAHKITAALILFIALPGNPVQAQFLVLESLPSGEYYYEKLLSSKKSINRYLLLSKRGHIVTGIDGQSLSKNPCFKGFVKQNSLVNVTRVFPPYDPASKWEFLKGEAFDLNLYRKVDRAIAASEKTALLKCIQVFSE